MRVRAAGGARLPGGAPSALPTSRVRKERHHESSRRSPSRHDVASALPSEGADASFPRRKTEFGARHRRRSAGPAAAGKDAYCRAASATSWRGAPGISSRRRRPRRMAITTSAGAWAICPSSRGIGSTRSWCRTFCGDSGAPSGRCARRARGRSRPRGATPGGRGSPVSWLQGTGRSPSGARSASGGDPPAARGAGAECQVPGAVGIRAGAAAGRLALRHQHDPALHALGSRRRLRRGLVGRPRPDAGAGSYRRARPRHRRLRARAVFRGARGNSGGWGRKLSGFVGAGGGVFRGRCRRGFR